jgi:hypothetical protein
VNGGERVGPRWQPASADGVAGRRLVTRSPPHEVDAHASTEPHERGRAPNGAITRKDGKTR